MTNTKLALIDHQYLSVRDLSAYINSVNQIPLLSREEESHLTNRFYQYNDLDAARKLILSHLRFVVRVAKGYEGYGLPLSDLIQEGNIGLMKAIKRFDPKVGVRLVSFAVHWIRAEIHEFILRNWRVVKIATTKAQRKLFFNLRKAAKKLNWFSEDEIETISKELNVSRKEVRQMEARLNQYDQSLDHSYKDYENDSHITPLHLLEDHSADPAQKLESADLNGKLRTLLYKGLNILDDRSRDIIKLRWLSEKKVKLQELAKKYQVSAERIRQIELQAIKKIREYMQSKQEDTL